MSVVILGLVCIWAVVILVGGGGGGARYRVCFNIGGR